MSGANFLFVDRAGRKYWWADVVQAMQELSDAVRRACLAAQPAMQALVSGCWQIMRAYPPEDRLNAIEQEYAFREFARRYNACHRGRRISWRRLNWQQRATAALDYLGTAPPE